MRQTWGCNMDQMYSEHGRNPHTRGNSWKRTGQDRTEKDKGSERMENTNKSQGRWEFPWIHQFLLTIYPQLQSHSKATKWTERQEGMEIGKRISKGIQKTQRKDHKSTSSFFAKKRRKIQSGNRHIRTCNKRSTIPRTRWEMETNSFLVKNNATGRIKLWDLW